MLTKEELEGLSYKKPTIDYKEYKITAGDLGFKPCSEETYYARNVYCARRNKQCLGCGLRDTTGFWDKGYSCNRGLSELETESIEFFKGEGIKLKNIKLNKKIDEITLFVSVGNTVVFKIDNCYYKGRVVGIGRLNKLFEIDIFVAPIVKDAKFNESRVISAEEYQGVLSK